MALSTLEVINLITNGFNLLVSKGYKGIRADVYEISYSKNKYGIYIVDHMFEMNRWLEKLQNLTTLSEIEVHFSKASRNIKKGCLAYLLQVILILDRYDITTQFDLPDDLYSILKLSFAFDKNTFTSRIV